MPTAASEALRIPLRQARFAQALTVVWMLIEGSIAVAAGVIAHSVALTAFGFDSFIELFSAAVVLRRVLERAAEEERGSLTTGERTASRLVGWALYLLIGYIVLSAIAGIALGIRAEPSPIGIGLALASLAIMAVLWRWRLNLADRLGSPALRGDAACSVVCLYLAGATLVGLGLNALFGFWWADSLAGVALIWWIRGEAHEAVEAGAGQANLTSLPR
ncbi:MAG TPA: cation transporter [Candidatus Dormibacteraeota bacterium]|jgi:divalent metal cation (Fe/Co/Zn/Cd) transporter